jgi:purine nucleoside permease
VSTSDVWFSGSLLSEAVANYTLLWTNGTGNYAFTAEEDNATFEAMIRAHKAGRVDFARVILMRTASDFDRAPPGLDS